MSFDDALRKLIGTPPPDKSPKPKKKRRVQRPAAC